MNNYYRILSIKSYLKQCMYEGGSNDNINYLIDLCSYFLNESLELNKENIIDFKDELITTLDFQQNNSLLEILPVIDKIEKELPNV